MRHATPRRLRPQTLDANMLEKVGGGRGGFCGNLAHCESCGWVGANYKCGTGAHQMTTVTCPSCLLLITRI